jgi:hypothetical protein
MPLTNEAHTSKEQDGTGGEETQAVTLERAVRSIPVLAYQDQGSTPHQEIKGFYWQFGQFDGTTDGNSQMRVPFKKEFPEGVAALVAVVAGVAWLNPIARDKTGFTIGPAFKTSFRNSAIHVDFLAIGF